MTSVEKMLSRVSQEKLYQEDHTSDPEQVFQEALEDYFRRAALTQRAPLPRWVHW